MAGTYGKSQGDEFGKANSAILNDPMSKAPVDVALYSDAPGKGETAIDNSPLTDSIARKVKKFGSK